LLVHMELNNHTWHLVRNTPKITGFVGGTRNPPPVPDIEVARITNRLIEDEEAPRPVLQFDRGEEIRVTDGPFATMRGSVEEVNDARGKLRVMVNFFGRSTSVELDYSQVEKVS